MTAEEMKAHIDQLIAKLREVRFPDPDDFHIQWIDSKDRDQAYALNDTSPIEVSLPEIRSGLDYATSLHELGHLCGRFQKSPNVLTRERWAWAWARKTALQWTPDMERDAQESMKWYEDQIRSGAQPGQDAEPCCALAGPGRAQQRCHC